MSEYQNSTIDNPGAHGIILNQILFTDITVPPKCRYLLWSLSFDIRFEFVLAELLAKFIWRGQPWKASIYASTVFTTKSGKSWSLVSYAYKHYLY